MSMMFRKMLPTTFLAVKLSNCMVTSKENRPYARTIQKTAGGRRHPETSLRRKQADSVHKVWHYGMRRVKEVIPKHPKTKKSGLPPSWTRRDKKRDAPEKHNRDVGSFILWLKQRLKILRHPRRGMGWSRISRNTRVPGATSKPVP